MKNIKDYINESLEKFYLIEEEDFEYIGSVASQKLYGVSITTDSIEELIIIFA